MLTQLSLFWFDFFREAVPTHIVTADVAEYPAPLPQFASQLEGRSMLVKRARMIDIECVARGYLSGSGWKEYKTSQSVCGISPARRPPGKRPSAGTHLHARHQGALRPRRERFV